jgi:hypothetical protein
VWTGRALEHLPGLHSQKSHGGGGLDFDALTTLYGEIYDEESVGELTVTVFESGDFGIFIDHESGDREPFLDGLEGDSARELAELLTWAAAPEPDDDLEQTSGIDLVDWLTLNDEIRVGYDHLGDVSIVLAEDDDRVDIGADEAVDLAAALERMADRYDEIDGGVVESRALSVWLTASRTLEHRAGLHDQKSHGRRFNVPGDRNSGFRKSRAELLTEERGRELDELRQSIVAAQRKADEVARTAAAAAPPPAKPTATPTRMTKGQYTKILKDEHVRLQMLDGMTEREAKAAARPTATIDALKERNKALRAKLRAAGVDHRTEEQRNSDDSEKTRLLDEVQRLAEAGGHDGVAKRAAAAKMTAPELQKFVKDVQDFQNRKAQQAKQAATARQDAAAHEEYERQRRSRPATDRQVSYIMNLLKNHGGGGFFNGPKDFAGVKKLTQGEASMYIDSLTDNY